MGSRCEMPLPVLASGLRRRRDEDDIYDLESSPPRRRKTVPTVDLTGDVGLVGVAQCLDIFPGNGNSYRTSDARFNSWVPDTQPHTQSSGQRLFQPFNLEPAHNLPGDFPSGTSLVTGPRSRIGTLPRAAAPPLSPISAPRPRATSPPRRATGRAKSPHSLLNIPSLPPRPKTINQSTCATASLCGLAETHFALELDSILHNGHLLRARKTVELNDGTFLRIVSIKNWINDEGDDQIRLHGSKFQRARDFLGLLGLKRNEVAMCSPSEDIPLSDVLKPRTLILTNAAFPKYRPPTQPDEREGRLICRWRIKIVSKQEGYMWRLQQHEVDEKYRMDDSELRERWRGGLVEIVKILQDGVLEDSPLPHKDLCEQEGFAEWSARKKNFVDLTAEKPARRERSDAGETHRTAIVTDDSSLELKQTSYAPSKRSLSGTGSSLGSSRYEATIDSRTPAGRFLGYFQGTYTPNPNTSPSSFCSSLRPEPQIASSPKTANIPSGTLATRPPAPSVGNSNPLNSNKKQFGVFNNPGFNTQPKKQAYQILGRPLTYGGGNFRSSTLPESAVTPRSIFRSNVYNNLKSCASSSKILGPFNSRPLTPTGHKNLVVKSKCSLVPQNITSSESQRKSFPERRGSLRGFNNFLKPPPSTQSAFKPVFSPSTRHKYKFGDAFCGGGGMSSGARSAGLVNTWSFDSNIDAATTYRKNFPGCKTYHMSVNEFVALPPEDLLVDIVHLSPPCQPHSPAHTVAGKDDDRNEASLFCVKECLEASRPRMATLEQTDGILNRQEWFRKLVNFFTDLGFSVSWKVLHGVEYGVPQTRKRLFLLAASPGEPLPDFPAPKHAHPTRDKHLSSNLPPPRTVRNAIGNIPHDSTCHQPLCFPNGFRPSPVDFDQPLRATILASGGPYDVHPSGMRPFTPRELACLQTFPATHDFAGSVFQKKKQIGNAVPPVLAEALLREVRKTMEKADRERSKKPVDVRKAGDVGVRKVGDVNSKKVGDGNHKKVGGGVSVNVEMEGELQTTIDILDDEGRVKVLRSLVGDVNSKIGGVGARKVGDVNSKKAEDVNPKKVGDVNVNVEMERELQTTIDILDDGGRVKILQSLGGDVNPKKAGDVSVMKAGDVGASVGREKELQTTIDMLDDEGRVKILQSLGGVPLVAVD